MNLNEMNRDQLRAEARRLGVKGYSAMRVPDLRDAVSEARVVKYQAARAGCYMPLPAEEKRRRFVPTAHARKARRRGRTRTARK